MLTFKMRLAKRYTPTSLAFAETLQQAIASGVDRHRIRRIIGRKLPYGVFREIRTLMP